MQAFEVPRRSGVGPLSTAEAASAASGASAEGAPRARRWPPRLAAGLAAVALAGPGAPALAARVAAVSPQGEVAQVQQVVVRFDQAVVPAGDPRRAAPFTLQCDGRAPRGDAYWADERRWVLDLQQPLPAGSRCTLSAAPAFVPLDGALQGEHEFHFSTGAPVVLSVLPYAGGTIAEDQHFLLRLNGAPDLEAVRRRAWCEVEGLGERMPVRLVEGAAREQALAALLPRASRARLPSESRVLLACQRPLPPEAGVRLVWGAGIGSARSPGHGSRQAQVFQWKVRTRFLAEFSCEREHARAPCLPLRPLTLRFSAPVPRAQAMAARLQPLAAGVGASASASAPLAPLSPRAAPQEQGDTLVELQFAAPLPEHSHWQLTLPADLHDDSSRPLANRGSFPLAVAVGGLPPLAKFAAAPFGIIEAGSAEAPALLPLTLRQVQADLAGARTGGRITVLRLAPDTADATLLHWMGRLHDDHRRQFETRAVSLLAGEAQVHHLALPEPVAPARATEIIGLPLPQRGLHVVEVASQLLGQTLLGRNAPMHARTGALVTNLGVHFKRGRTSSLVWVTTLDRGRPVAGARVAVNDCRGRPLWDGVTDAAGIARIARGFEEEYDEHCLLDEGLFVSARTADDLGFVFSRWHRGIEPWRFGLPTADGITPDRRAHTVFDRTLVRRGDTVHMKHFVRDDGPRGPALPAPESLPTEIVITHLGSGTEIRQPLAWPRGPRASASTWTVPALAALGRWEVALQRGDQRLASGSLRVEDFRVPLLDARLDVPAGVQVAPQALRLSAQLNAMGGGPVAGAPLSLSALLRPLTPTFVDHEDFSFAAPAPAEAAAGVEAQVDGAGDEAAGPARLVADRLGARTDAQGAATIELGGLPALDGVAELVAELRFDDPSGEVQTVAQRLRLWPAALVVGLRVPDWAASRGRARFTAVVLGTDGRPQAGREVSVEGRSSQVYSTRKRIVGGFYAWEHHREAKPLGTLCSGRTDARGRLDCEAAIAATGEVELLALARDDAGRASRATASVWMAGENAWWFAQGNDDRIDLLPEQPEVQPGQTARLQLRMPFERATALVSVEREGIVDARVVELSGRAPVIELPVPADAGRGADGASWAPNVTVSVLVLRGRLRQAPWWSLFTWGWRDPADWWRAFRNESPEWRAPGVLVDLAKPAFKLGVAQLRVGTAAHRLDVRVDTDRAQARVRDTVQATVQVSHRGRPLAGAEVAFVAVDEGLLALQDNTSWDLLGALMPPRPWGVTTATAQGEIVGRRHYGRKALPPGGGGGRNPTRELLDTLLLWRDTVTLDAQGRARITVPMNDSLTRFRLVAVADAPGGGNDPVQRFGSGHATVQVTQDLQLLSGLAPLAREGDRFEAGFTLRNTTARAMTVRATLAGEAVRASDAAPLPLALAPQTVTLAAGAAQELRWPVEVPAGTTRLDWRGEALETGAGGGGASDRLKLSQAVAPAVPLRVWQASLQPLDGVLSLPLAPPADALAGRTRTVLALQPRLSGALPGLRRWFESYPFTCLEQKVSRALALHDEAGWARLRDELPGHLDGDGLAGYFPPPPGQAPRGSDRLSAYLVSAAHEAGRAWPEATRDALLAGLSAFVEGRIERRFMAPRADLDVRKLAALEALARHGRVQPRMLDSIAWVPASWPTSALLDAWSLLRRVDGLPRREARLDELQRLLRSRLVAGGTTLRFATEADDDWWWLMDGPDANAARLLLAAVETPAWQAELPRLLQGTLARQQRGAWLTTTANLWGVLALERFAARFEATPVSGRSTVQLGRAEATHDWAARPEGGTQTLPGPDGVTTLKARHEGGGRPWLALQTLAAVPLNEPLAAGYRIHKTLTPLQRRRPDGWSRGDTVRVRLEIEATADRSWVAVLDPLPAGATLLGSGLARDSALATQGERAAGGGWLAWEERGADAWRGYYEWLPRGRQVVEYTLRLNAIGRFGLPPTRVEAMYAPETFGERPNATLEVQP